MKPIGKDTLSSEKTNHAIWMWWGRADVGRVKVLGVGLLVLRLFPYACIWGCCCLCVWGFELKKDLEEMKRKQQPTPSTPVATAPGSAVKHAHAKAQAVGVRADGEGDDDNDCAVAAAAAESITAEPMALASSPIDLQREQ